MSAVRVECLECGRGWDLPGGASVYELQALEACPCPWCGACILAVADEEESPTLAARAEE